jgi:probable HAF family extracellular repeat protein
MRLDLRCRTWRYQKGRRLVYAKLIAAVALLGLLVPATAMAAPPIPRYRIVEIPLSYSGTASGMNNRGDVVGTAAPYGFLYDYRSGAVTYLTVNSENFIQVNGINDEGLIVGSAFPDGVAVVWSKHERAEVLAAGYFCPYCSANAVNNQGLIVGDWAYFGYPGGGPLAWRGPQHTLEVLPILECAYCVNLAAVANAVNDEDHIVGTSMCGSPPDVPNPCYGDRAVMWRDGTIKDLGQPSGVSGLNGTNYESFGNGINNLDDVVGSFDGPAAEHAFLYHREKMVDIGTLPGDLNSSAASINDRGDIVGWSTSYTTQRAFIYVDGRMLDLNTLIDREYPREDAVQLSEAVGINSAGWIAANGTSSRDDLMHAYLLIREERSSEWP